MGMISYCSTSLYEAAPEKRGKGLEIKALLQGLSNPRELCQSHNVNFDYSLCNSHAYQPHKLFLAEPIKTT